MACETERRGSGRSTRMTTCKSAAAWLQGRKAGCKPCRLQSRPQHPPPSCESAPHGPAAGHSACDEAQCARPEAWLPAPRLPPKHRGLRRSVGRAEAACEPTSEGRMLSNHCVSWGALAEQQGKQVAPGRQHGRQRAPTAAAASPAAAAPAAGGKRIKSCSAHLLATPSACRAAAGGGPAALAAAGCLGQTAALQDLRRKMRSALQNAVCPLAALCELLAAGGRLEACSRSPKLVLRPANREKGTASAWRPPSVAAASMRLAWGAREAAFPPIGAHAALPVSIANRRSHAASCRSALAGPGPQPASPACVQRPGGRNLSMREQRRRAEQH